MDSFLISDGVLKKYCSLEDSVVIPEGVEVIGSYSFSDHHQIQSITFPSTLKIIESFAFYKCSGLESVSLPYGLVEIGDYAFGECRKLEFIAIPDSVKVFGKDFLQSCYCDIKTNIWPAQLSHAISDYEIRGIHTDSISVIPTTYRNLAAVGFAREKGEINNNSERDKSHIKYIKRNVERLCATAIWRPELLHLMCENRLIEEKSIDLYLRASKEAKADEMTALLEQYQVSLDQVKMQKEHERKKTAIEKKKEQVQINQTNRNEEDGIKGLTFVISGKLTNQSYYRYEKLWESHRELEEYLHFYGAELSDRVTVRTNYVVSCLSEPSEKKEQVAKELGIPIITEDVFHNLIAKKFLRSKYITVPSWVKTIPRYASYGIEPTRLFVGANDTNVLETLILTEGLEKIEKEAFCYCRKLRHVTIPDTVRSIEQGAFKSCECLSEVSIPSGMACLEDEVFSDCLALKKVWLPDSVVQISASAFRNCPSVTIYTPRGSYAEQFAKNAGIPVVPTA